VRVERHAVVLEPHASGGGHSAFCEIDAPEQARERVRHEEHARRDQARAVERADRRAEFEHPLGLNPGPGGPVAQVKPLKRGLVRGVAVRGADVEDVGLGLDDVKA
jgi:hypothetical protein